MLVNEYLQGLPPHLTKGEWKATFNEGFSDVNLSVK